MNNKHKRILFHIAILASSADCWMMLAEGIKPLFFLAIIGLLAGIILWQIYARQRQHVSKINKILSLIAALLLCYKLSCLCYHTWIKLPKLEILTSQLSLNTELFLRILTCAMGFIALPSAGVGLLMIFQLLAYCWRLVDWRKVWETFAASISIKSALRMAGNLAASAIIGTLLLIGAYFLPVAKIDKHVEDSATIFKQESVYPTLFSWCTSRLDNFTDAIMLLEAADSTDDSVVNRAMRAYRGAISDYNPNDVLVAYYLDKTEFDKSVTYSRFWHGYQVLLKPLLSLMDYHAIRILNAIVQVSLVVLIVCLLVRRKMCGFVIPYLLSYLMLMPVTLAKSLSYSPCYYVLTFATAVLLAIKSKQKEYVFFIFFYTGMTESFFDFLTYPIATFGVPASIFLSMHSDSTLEQRLGILLKLLVCWGIGYAGMWGLKWIIAGIITGDNVILDALHAFLFRVSHGYKDRHFTLFQCVKGNVRTFIRTPFSFWVVAFIFMMCIQIKKNKSLSFREVCGHLMPYAIVALLPLLWYAFALNHSVIHTNIFANKTCVVSVLAVMCAFVELSRLSGQHPRGNNRQTCSLNS